MPKRRGPNNKPNNKASERVHKAAESVLRRNSALRSDYDARDCKPPISQLQGRPVVEVAGHIIARLHEAGSSAHGLDDVSTFFRDNAIPVRVIDLATA